MDRETPMVELPGDVRIPMIGFGTAGLLDIPGYTAVRNALDAGYRHLDTATAYRNEAEIGRAVRDSGLDRSTVFITTKLPPEEAGNEAAVLERSLRALDVDYIDLWLVHWPPAGEATVRVWEALLSAHDAGKVRAVGVSNHTIEQIDQLAAATGVTPALNQVPYSPLRHDPGMLAASHGRNVVVEGYSPLRRTNLGHPTLVAIARTHAVTPAQVVLQWHLHHNIVVIPKSSDPGRIRANFDLSSFQLTPDEITAIDAMANS
jgi:diketogulonate reductase-like aldo/keto reductase